MNLEQLVTDYERDGVIRVRGLFAPSKVREIGAELERYIQDIVPGLPTAARTYEVDGQSVRNIWHLENYDAYFARLAAEVHIHHLVKTLVQGEPVLVAVETFNKPAKTGSGVPWHQDNAYFCQSPPDVLTVWVALDPATVENGAVYYVPGSQHELLPHVASGVVGNSMGLAQSPTTPVSDQFCGTLEAGDALIHHCQTMHRSDPNRSKKPRLGLLMVFRASHTQDDPQLKAKYSLSSAAT